MSNKFWQFGDDSSSWGSDNSLSTFSLKEVEMRQNRKFAWILLCAVTLMGAVSAQAAKIEVECPEEVKSRQSPVPMKGWATYVEAVNPRQVFTGLSLYSGHPKDGVVLFADETAEAAPTNSASATPASSATPGAAPVQAGVPYKIPAGKEGFVVCQYTNTLVRLIKKLPKDIQVCHVKFSETLGHVQKAVCD